MEVINSQVSALFLLAIPIACTAWTVTHEEIFKEPRAFCAGRCKNGKRFLNANFFIFLPVNIVSAIT